MLKATELQLYDWVKLKNHKGEWIDNSQIDANLMFLALKQLDNDDPFFVFEDIPLTEEMLKANGIPTNGDLFHFAEDDDYCMELQYEKGKLLWMINIGEYEIMTFHSVRQFQHALRICGLTDPANNFRLK